MATLPYMQLYVADYLADTMHLTTEESGAYMFILMNYWQKQQSLPANRLARIARLSDDRWTDVEQSLKEFFTIDPETGNWVHDRIEKDLEKVRLKSARCVKAGKASAKVRKAQAIEKANKLNGRSTIEDKDKDKDKEKDKRREQPIVRPAQLNSEAWDEYLKHRRDIKVKKLTKIGEERAIEKMCRYSHDEQRKAIDRTIESGWTGVFPERTFGNRQSAGSFIELLKNQYDENLD